MSINIFLRLYFFKFQEEAFLKTFFHLELVLFLVHLEPFLENIWIFLLKFPNIKFKHSKYGSLLEVLCEKFELS